MVVKKPGLCGHYKLLRARIRHAVNDKRHRRPLRKTGRGCQNNTTLSVEYSREGSKADEANPSDAVLGIWACNVPVREHQASAARACNVPFGEHQASAVLSCNVPVREHQGSAVQACNVPVRNNRPRDHDARPDPRSLAPCPRRALAKNVQKLLLTAFEGAGGVRSCSCLTRDAILP